MLGRRAELMLGAVFLLLGLFVIVVWVPQDSETWMIETFRRQTTMGDAFLPMIAGALVAICAAIHLFMTLRRNEEQETDGPVFDGAALAFLVQLSGLTALCLAVMYWAGPIAVQLFASGETGDAATYRQMRGTYPYKLLGFVLGGFSLVFLTTSLIEGRFKVSRVISSILAVIVLIVIFDLPFDNILLPPNGDW
ncbi:hypothetical protein N6L24_14775 [Cognatishimia sp. SS12]|uniref:hypothetical protein n=1 Tax=Cognatishimia sp. SS12 TaxID=2979465 RepID=UPI00232C51D2|nr:hypothetical protein [Cognatishimia sp. SS12]MDC0739551.1 hypothetical protein [Cognatishimia sp. SS12]